LQVKTKKKKYVNGKNGTALQKGVRTMPMPTVAHYLVAATGKDSCIDMDTRSR